MRTSILIITLTTLLIGCSADSSDDSAPSEASLEGCAWDDARLATPASPPELRSSPGAELSEALIGRWQHVYTVTDGGGPEPLNDTTDVRFAFPGDGTVTYCQHITGTIEVGPNERKVNFTLDGAVLDFPEPAPGYEALAWNADVMLWKNLGNPAETYVLLKR